MNQVQFSPFRYRRRLLDYCLEQGIVFEAYSPLARAKGLDDRRSPRLPSASSGRRPR